MSSKTLKESKLGHGNQRPKTEQSFYACPDTSNFDDDLIKKGSTSMETPFPIKIKSLSSAQHFPSLWNTQGQVTIMPIVQTTLK